MAAGGDQKRCGFHIEHQPGLRSACSSKLQTIVKPRPKKLSKKEQKGSGGLQSSGLYSQAGWDTVVGKPALGSKRAPGPKPYVRSPHAASPTTTAVTDVQPVHFAVQCPVQVLRLESNVHLRPVFLISDIEYFAVSSDLINQPL